MALWLMLSSPATHSRTADTAITAAAPCVCLICLLFCDNKREGGQIRFFFSCSFFFLLWITGPKSGNLKTQGERAADTGDCQADCDKTFTRKLSPCHKALLFWIPKGLKFPNKLWKVEQFRALPNDSVLQYRSHLWTTTLEELWSRDFNLCISA